MFHSNHGPILYRSQDKWWFQSKIANFPPRVFNTPAWRGSPSNLLPVQKVEKTMMMGLPDGRKSFKIDLAFQTQNQRVTDIQPAIFWQQKTVLTPCVARVKRGKIHWFVQNVVLQKTAGRHGLSTRLMTGYYNNWMWRSNLWIKYNTKTWLLQTDDKKKQPSGKGYIARLYMGKYQSW